MIPGTARVRSYGPAPWRGSLASDELRERLDEAVESLSRARTGVSMVDDRARRSGRSPPPAWELAEAVEQRARQRAGRAG
jgi:hypothetical protein